MKPSPSGKGFDVVRVLRALATERPVFHSEADFQHAVAWAVHEVYPDAALRLEYKPWPVERVYIDIWVRLGGEQVAIELKYPTRGISVEVQQEAFMLRDQAAQDITRYDFIKDIVRLERAVREGIASRGMAIMLTNDSAYWKQPLRTSSVDAAFRISDGRVLSGTLSWAENTGLGTMRSREAALALVGSHAVRWEEYSAFPGSYGQFKFCVLPVTSPGQAS
jgi:hypothetical protein